MTFDQFSLDARLMQNVRSAGYAVPTPIQTAAIPTALPGQDLIGTAQPGTGTTAAFVLPILQRLLNTPRARGAAGCRALIVTPTRELAEQINDTVRALGRGTCIRSATIYGGVPMDPKPEAVYQTGSNIPRKSTGATTVDQESLERSQELNVPRIRSGKAS